MNKISNILMIIFLSVVGTLWHFVYEWTGNNYYVGLFFPTNESVWEHLKLLFFPTIIYSILEYTFIKEKPENYISAVTFSLLAGMFSIVAGYYTYKGILGYNISILDVSTFFLGVIVLILIKNFILKKDFSREKLLNIISLIILITLTVLFIKWSYNPPNINLFRIP